MRIVERVSLNGRFAETHNERNNSGVALLLRAKRKSRLICGKKGGEDKGRYRRRSMDTYRSLAAARKRGLIARFLGFCALKELLGFVTVLQRETIIVS